MENDKFQELVLEQLNSLTEQVAGLKEDVAGLRQSQARMEFDHGEKLSVLFDGYNSISETLADHTDRLQRIEDKISTHDIQIQVLDRTKSNKRKAKS